MLIEEHVKNNESLNVDLKSSKDEFKKLKKHHTAKEMELALKTAQGKRNNATLMADEAEELLEKKKMELEELKNELKNKINEQTN